MIYFLIFVLSTFTPENAMEKYMQGDYKGAFAIFNTIYKENTNLSETMYGYFYALSSCDTILSKNVFEGIIKLYPKHLYRIDAYREMVAFYIMKDMPLEAMQYLIALGDEYPSEKEKPYYKSWNYYLSKTLKMDDTLFLKKEVLNSIYFKKVQLKKQKQRKENIVIKKEIAGSKDTNVSYSIQVAALSTYNRANKLKIQLNKKYSNVHVVKVNGIYKVRVGKYKTRNGAQKILLQLKKSYKDAFIVKEG